MWAKERHQRILSMLAANQQVSANDLAGMLGVSRETVRRDLDALARVGGDAAGLGLGRVGGAMGLGRGRGAGLRVL